MTQIIVFLLVGCRKCVLLAVMSYDRYVAVCKPLRYSTIMTQRVCLWLSFGSWASGALASLVDTSFTFHLPYWGQNIINHYFCEPPVLLKLASADTYNTAMAIFSMSVVILLAPVSLILVSHWNIISTVIQMQSGEGRLKAFSTGGSHLIVVVLFYKSGIFTYMRPNSKTTKEWDKMISVFYTVVTPMLNPIIYRLRNKDVKGVLRKLAERKSFSHRHRPLSLTFRAMTNEVWGKERRFGLVFPDGMRKRRKYDAYFFKPSEAPRQSIHRARVPRVRRGRGLQKGAGFEKTRSTLPTQVAGATGVPSIAGARAQECAELYGRNI
ncbi:PREDICTED: olfactory receptor 2D3 [Rhinopithecus bieti]|uniref:olfactory receptor 2D3 n=1 Tax=Rhinopithecus bieti TaxID=61621 RepID=UPI00083C6EFC|nr:PREDICTED: olfactory receptor 2D3 [Rhinopithecus bieti]